MRNQYFNKFWIFIAGLFCLILICAYGNYFTFGSIVPPPPKPVQETLIVNSEIVSLGRETGITGGFILGFGAVGSTFYYIAYEKQAENTYRLLKIEADRVDVTESDSEKPSYKVYRSGGLRDRKILVVPKGTIRREFKL